MSLPGPKEYISLEFIGQEYSVDIGNDDYRTILSIDDNDNLIIGNRMPSNLASNSGDIYFKTGTGTPGSQSLTSTRVTITRAGKMGIGVTDPSEQLEVDGDVLADGYRVSAMQTAPSSRGDTGTLGEIRVTADYIYVCYATNSWKRVAISQW